MNEKYKWNNIHYKDLNSFELNCILEKTEYFQINKFKLVSLENNQNLKIITVIPSSLYIEKSDNNQDKKIYKTYLFIFKNNKFISCNENYIIKDIKFLKIKFNIEKFNFNIDYLNEYQYNKKMILKK